MSLNPLIFRLVFLDFLAFLAGRQIPAGSIRYL